MSTSLEAEKSQQACEILKEIGVDAWLVWVRETSQMADPVLDIILGADLVWQSALVHTRQGETMAIIGRLDAEAIRTKGIFGKVIPYDKDVRAPLLEELDRLDPNQIAIDYSTTDVSADGLSVGMHRILMDYLKDTRFQSRLMSAESLIGKLRGRKTATELSRIQKAVEITEGIFVDIQKQLKAGMTELSIYHRVHQLMSERGVLDAWNPDHNPAVDAGPNKEFGHSGPTQNKTKTGHLLHFDFGVRSDGYCSDIQRMYFFGEPADIPQEITDAFETARDAIQLASQFIKPGVTGNEVDTVARDHVKERGYEEFKHALGHQLGRLAHDGGTLLGPCWEKYGTSPRGVVEVGNVFTLELYVTTPSYGQVSLEEDIVVTQNGCRFLSHPQRDLLCVT